MKMAAAYVRVSTEEQALHGYSIQAQREAIQAYARANGCKIVAEYADEGVSGKKPFTKRPALSRFMRDLENGQKVDVLLFTKLDRLFRSVKHYYSAAEVLDRYHVSWVAIHEDYETESANGRLKVNMMLSIAEHEADRTSERIRAVNESKARNGYAVTGSLPFGLKIVEHRVVIDTEKAPIIRDVFRIYRDRHSAIAVVRELQKKYNVTFSKEWALKVLRNPLFRGEYRGNPTFCEALISREEFDEIQSILKERAVTQTKSGRVYLFSGLLKCKECDGALTIAISSAGYYYYRCTKYALHHMCTHKRQINEDALEKWLLLNARSQLDAAAVRMRTEFEQTRKAAPDKTGILRKLNRIKDAYLTETIPLDVFRAEYESLSAQLEVIEKQEREQPEPPHFDRTKERLTALDGEYQGMNRQGKQTFWRQIINKIVIDNENNVQVYFL